MGLLLTSVRYCTAALMIGKPDNFYTFRDGPVPRQGSRNSVATLNKHTLAEHTLTGQITPVSAA